MANPTANIFLNANANYVWQDGDVYEIQQPDTTEGAALGASFGGLGVDNQPHQILLNKINYLKAHSSAATSDVGVNGWYRLVSQDQNLGAIGIIEQWGFIPAAAFNVPLATPNFLLVSFTFPLTFTSVCWNISAVLAVGTTVDPTNIPNCWPVYPFQNSNNQIMLRGITHNQVTTGEVQGAAWRAIGY